MDMVLGMALTAVLLFQEAENTLGRTAALDPVEDPLKGSDAPGPPGTPFGAAVDEGRKRMEQSLAATFRELELREITRGQDIEETYRTLRRMIGQSAQRRRG